MEISDAISAAGPSCLITVSFADGILCARDGLNVVSSVSLTFEGDQVMGELYGALRLYRLRGSLMATPT